MRLPDVVRRLRHRWAPRRRRERRGNSSGGVYALTVLLRVRAGAEGALAARLADLEGCSPFAKLPATHFARFVLVPASFFAGGERERERRRRSAGWYLLLSSTFDGSLDHYLDALCANGGAELEEIWRCCDGFPVPGLADAGACNDYLRRHQLHTGLFFNAYPWASVADILASLERRARLQTFALRGHALEPEQLKTEFLHELAATKGETMMNQDAA
jgi:hypothetical protein